MKINGYWLGAGLLMLLDYIYFLFISSEDSYFGLVAGLTMFLMIIFFGLAFRDSHFTGKESK